MMGLAIGFLTIRGLWLLDFSVNQEKYLDQEIKNRTCEFFYFILLFCVVEKVDVFYQESTWLD